MGPDRVRRDWGDLACTLACTEGKVLLQILKSRQGARHFIYLIKAEWGECCARVRCQMTESWFTQNSPHFAGCPGIFVTAPLFTFRRVLGRDREFRQSPAPLESMQILVESCLHIPCVFSKVTAETQDVPPLCCRGQRPFCCNWSHGEGRVIIQLCQELKTLGCLMSFFKGCLVCLWVSRHLSSHSWGPRDQVWRMLSLY